jgi:hypothetical protein
MWRSAAMVIYIGTNYAKVGVYVGLWCPKLKRFGGKATDYSPRAKIRHWMG